MSESSDELHPTSLVYHYNRYSTPLFDVDGNPLRGETGRLLNVYQEELKDLMVAKKIRFIHYLTTEPTYAYFVTSPQQEHAFRKERECGSRIPDKRYHVYIDH